MVFPFAVKVYPWQSNIAVTVSNRCTCVVAQSSLTASRVSTSRSPEGSSDRSVLAISTVGMMAWWSVTLLSSVTRSMSGSPAQPFPKGILSRSHRIRKRRLPACPSSNTGCPFSDRLPASFHREIAHNQGSVELYSHKYGYIPFAEL